MGLYSSLEREGAYRLPWPWLYTWIEAVSAFLDGFNPSVTQPTWFIDPVNGSDFSTGLTATTALKTWAEFSRRMGFPGGSYVNSTVVVTVVSSTPATDPLNLNLYLGPLGKFTLTGIPTVTRASTLTAVTAINRATPQALEVTDGAFVWTPNLGQFFQITSGPRVGASAWVAKNVGAGVGRLSNTVVPSAVEFGLPTVVTPVIGDAYALSTFPAISIGWLDVQGANTATLGTTTALFQNLQMNGLSGAKGVISTQALAVNQFNNIFFNGITLQASALGAMNTCNCRFVGSVGTGMVVLAGLINNGGLAMFDGQANFLDYDVLGQGGLFTIAQNTFVQVGTVAAFDTTGADNAVRIEGRSCLYSRNYLSGVNQIWGGANTGHGMFVESGSACIYVTKPTVNAGLGAGREASIGGVDTLWAAVPAVTAANNAEIVARA